MGIPAQKIGSPFKFPKPIQPSQPLNHPVSATVTKHVTGGLFK